ncbi:serine hydrolase domain-containing protein [Salinibacterium hongtaonis]|uniref:serine hydrolase domain-containing protein n=1 Tax=Homoserinimonas hongtaonis TaxID=2079791 RepID=UPI000D3B19C9|nr:serine hydrolase domain-containing protein [Salinibacterium hongtaonis]AWB89092.1 serine hydrolase [Salinibacterium hongtaonis]
MTIQRGPASADAAGDTELAERTHARLGSRHPVVAVATVTSSGARTAALGTPLTSRFEIGSITKAVTGLLYMDAVERAEVRPATTLGELLPLGECPAAGVTLASLATHTSGLPRLAPSRDVVRRSWNLMRRGTNPYGDTLDELVVGARRATVRPARYPRYSNLGFELLGHAVASAAGTDYAALLRDRIADPLGLESFAALSGSADLTESDLMGRNSRGKIMEAWTGEAIAPAGGIRSTIGDMGDLAAALLNGSAAGMLALEPAASMSSPAMKIGAAWITLESKGRIITWHNGGTGGFCAWMGLDREAHVGVVILSATAIPVDRYGFDLLAELSEPSLPE